ncbi:hypothetical protein [Paraburkholderia humisilvae]|uniref:hypothetical protein n=1 Tax=Paraburkholderia humisilvae TaxID=627669 RepID=UPI0015831F11|nr:hypothetical protein [Paraburkholderia humisilvae]
MNWGATTSGVIEPEIYGVARERYEDICLELGIHNAPTLRLAKKVTFLSKIVIGDWRRSKSIRAAAHKAIPTDQFFLHEIAHALCLKYVGYRGYHGIPFLVLLQLLYEFHWEGEVPNAIAHAVREDWPRYVSTEEKGRTIFVAWKVVDAIKSGLEAQETFRPSADTLAHEVRKAFPDQVSRPRGRFGPEVLRDMVKTQRDGLFSLALWSLGAAALSFGTLNHFFPSAATHWTAVSFWLLLLAVLATIAATDVSRRIGRLWRRLVNRFSPKAIDAIGTPDI